MASMAYLALLYTNSLSLFPYYSKNMAAPMATAQYFRLRREADMVTLATAAARGAKLVWRSWNMPSVRVHSCI